MNGEKQIKIIGIATIIYGILLGLFFLLIMTIWTALPGSVNIGEPLWILGLIVGLLYICIYFIAGIGLLKHKSWARILLIILSIIGLFSFPIGTAIGIWFLIVLFNKEVKNIFS